MTIEELDRDMKLKYHDMREWNKIAMAQQSVQEFLERNDSACQLAFEMSTALKTHLGQITCSKTDAWVAAEDAWTNAVQAEEEARELAGKV